MIHHLFAIVLAVVLDAFIGDPRWMPHPVREIGTLIAYFDRHLNRGGYKRLKGSVTVALVCLIVYASGFFLIYVSYQISTVFGIFIEALIIFTTIATKSLKDAAYDVLSPLERGEIEKARRQLSMIVGRDTERLGEGEIVRGCVETVAENTSDGITAPLFFAFIGGGALALVYRAVNTCDSMLGYKNEIYRDFGWASARLDDVLNYVPARLTSIVMVLANSGKRKRTLRQCFKLLIRDARKHPSPNSGWGEAAMAALLGVQLGGTNTYKGVVSHRPKIGEPLNELRKEQIREAVKIMIRTVIAFVVLLWIGGILIELAVSWSESASFI